MRIITRINLLLSSNYDKIEFDDLNNKMKDKKTVKNKDLLDKLKAVAWKERILKEELKRFTAVKNKYLDDNGRKSKD